MKDEDNKEYFSSSLAIRAGNEPSGYPYVSVIMPVHNEEEFIADSLNAILDQDYPLNRMEVIIADGMSSDNTKKIIHRIAKGSKVPVEIIDNHARIVPIGMNIAIQRAVGEIIVRIDGHTIVENDYIRQCVLTLKNTGATNVGGPMNAVGEGYICKGITLATSTPFGLGNSAFHYSIREQYVDTVYLGAFRKEILFKVGLFDENFVRHQDYELNYRIRKSGGKIFLSPKIRSRYYVRNSLRKLSKQYFQYGVWKGRFVRKYPEAVRLRHLVPPSFLSVLVLSGLFSVFSNISFLTFGLTVGAYALFILTAMIFFALKGQCMYLPALSIIFPCIHLTWGTGVWIGLFMKKLK